MRVWIDASNSPHPLLFAPISRLLEARGHEVVATAREHAQTAGLARRHWPSVTVIGGESPGGRARKGASLLRRVRDLRAWAKATAPDVALSHNSYAQIAAARSLGIPAVTAMDFEHQPANHLAFRLARIILLPGAIPDAALRRHGASGTKVWRYEGLKESIYLGDFEPDPGVLVALGVSAAERPLVVARTPPSRALYHRNENRLFLDCLRALSGRRDTTCVVLARHQEQRAELSASGFERLIIPDAVVDSRALLYEADLFLGAGGTMTREAALMGIPTFTVFAGPVPAVDRDLEARGLMKRLLDPDQLVATGPRTANPRSPAELREDAEPVLERFVAAVEAAGG